MALLLEKTELVNPLRFLLWEEVSTKAPTEALKPAADFKQKEEQAAAFKGWRKTRIAKDWTLFIDGSKLNDERIRAG